MIDVPELVQRRARANGAAGRAWLASLPEVVGELARRWGLRVGASFAGGTASYVAAATDASGRDCVLKVPMPLDYDDGSAFRRSVTVHQLAAGEGCVALLAHHDAPQAMLLERLGRNLHDLQMPLDEILDAVATTLLAFWRPVGDDCELPTGAEGAAWLAEHIVSTWDQLSRPCPRVVIDRALDYCAARAAAYDPRRAVLVHGDAHGWNTLARWTRDAGDSGNTAPTFKFVDPEGLRSEREHDLGIPMREYNAPLLLGDAAETVRLTRQRAERLAAACHVDPEAVWQWGFIERVSTGLIGLRELGADNASMGAEFLEVATRCA